MIGLDIENINLKKELLDAISRAGYTVCEGCSAKLDLLIIQNDGDSELMEKGTKIILITDNKNNPNINRCNYFMISPINVSRLISVIEEMDIKEKDYSVPVSEILLDLGISPITKGYAYLKDAVNFYTNHKNCFVKDVYEIIGIYRNVSPKSVERSIRYAIESAFDRCRVDSQERIFRNSINPLKGKPTNLEFIYRIADLVETKNQKENIWQ